MHVIAAALGGQLSDLLASAGPFLFYLAVWGLIFVGTGLLVGVFIPFITGDSLLFASGLIAATAPNINPVILAVGVGVAAFLGPWPVYPGTIAAVSAYGMLVRGTVRALNFAPESGAFTRMVLPNIATGLFTVGVATGGANVQFAVSPDGREAIARGIEIGMLGAYGSAMQTRFNGFHSSVAATVWPEAIPALAVDRPRKRAAMRDIAQPVTEPGQPALSLAAPHAGVDTPADLEQVRKLIGAV